MEVFLSAVCLNFRQECHYIGNRNTLLQPHALHTSRLYIATDIDEGRTSAMSMACCSLPHKMEVLLSLHKHAIDLKIVSISEEKNCLRIVQKIINPIY